MELRHELEVGGVEAEIRGFLAHFRGSQMFEIWCESRSSLAAAGYPPCQWTCFEILVREISQTWASVGEARVGDLVGLGVGEASCGWQPTAPATTTSSNKRRDDQLTSSELRCVMVAQLQTTRILITQSTRPWVTVLLAKTVRRMKLLRRFFWRVA